MDVAEDPSWWFSHVLPSPRQVINETGFVYSVVGKTICYIDGNHHVYQRLRVPWWCTQSTTRKGNPPCRSMRIEVLISCNDFFLLCKAHANTPWRNMEDISTRIQYFVQHQVATSRKLYGTIDDGRRSVNYASYGSDGYTPDLGYTDRSTWWIWTLTSNVVTISTNSTYKKRIE